MGIGDWGLGIGDWANTQSQIRNPLSPIPNNHHLSLKPYFLIFNFAYKDKDTFDLGGKI